MVSYTSCFAPFLKLRASRQAVEKYLPAYGSGCFNCPARKKKNLVVFKLPVKRAVNSCGVPWMLPAFHSLGSGLGPGQGGCWGFCLTHTHTHGPISAPQLRLNGKSAHCLAMLLTTGT